MTTNVTVATLLNAVTAAPTNGAGVAPNLNGQGLSFQATVSGTGAVTSAVNIQGSNDGSNWVTLGTITLSGTTSATDGFAASAPWAQFRAALTSISGSGASVIALMGS